jgi:hypothetical protein
VFFYAGYVGTERVWYLRLWRKKPMQFGDIWRMSRSFIGSYLALGFLASLPLLPVYIFFPTTSGGFDFESFIVTAIATAAYDILLTFATPAIAYTTRDPVEALKISFRTIRHQWPRSGMYALVPPLAALLFLRFLPERTLPVGTVIGLTAVGVLLNLLFKGATAAFYLRFNEVPDDGTLNRSPHVSTPSSPVAE